MSRLGTRTRCLVVAGAAAMALAIPAATAWADTPDPSCVTASPSNPTCGGTETNVEPGVAVQGETAVRSTGGGTLPVTGGDIAGLAAIGVGLTGVGIVLARQGRKARQTS